MTPGRPHPVTELVLIWLRDAAGAARERGHDAQTEASRAKSVTYRNACQTLADAHFKAAKVYEDALEQEVGHVQPSGS